jgi:adenylate cyclase
MDLAATFALAFLGAFLALTVSAQVRSIWTAVGFLASAAIAAAAYVLFAQYLFVEDRIWIAVAGPLLAMFAAFGVTTVFAVNTERELRDFITGVLGRYVSPEVARQVTHDPSLVRPERRRLTLFHSFVDGFSKLTEPLTPAQKVELLNEYFTVVTSIVTEKQGYLDKYIADSVLAFWGAPVRTARHAALACDSALRIRDAVERHREGWQKRFGVRLIPKSGIDTAEAVVGDLGSELKSNYSVLGAVVAHASSLAGLNGRFGSSILVGEATREAAGTGFVFREVARVKSEGQEGFHRLFELVGRASTVSRERRDALAEFEAALETYRNKDFAAAAPVFERLVQQFGDPVAELYLGRSRAFMTQPPEPGWDSSELVRALGA